MGCKLAWVGYKILSELALEENRLRKSTRSCRQRTRLSSRHPLAVESDGQPARAAMRAQAGIPDQFMILGEQLRHAALSAGTINDILVLNACASGL